MSSPSPLFARPRSPSTSSSSTDASDGFPAPSSVTSLRHRAENMDRRQGRVFSQSNPELLHHVDGTNNSSQWPGEPTGIHPHRTHSHGAVASHFLAQSPEEYGGQTWMDFLRETGADPNDSAPQPNTLPALVNNYPSPSSSRFSLPARQAPSNTSSRSSSDRKRRLTTAESPMRRPSSIRMHSGTAGGSSSDSMLLDSSPAPARPPPPPSFPSQTSTGSMRRESDIVLPPWQPDSEVTHCPVCGSQFTFFYRKHHCRKCGRVVCSACSPHRITIPRQFIVHPPSENPNIIDLTAEEDDNTMSAFGPFRNPALGGGEEVRVCNPCVPDPNYNPPPQYNQGPAPPYPTQYSSLPRPQPLPGPGSLNHLYSRGHRSTQSVNDGAQTVGHRPTSRPRDPFNDRGVSFHSGPHVADLWSARHPQQPVHAHPSPYDHRPRAHSRPTPGSISTSMHSQAESSNYPGSSMFRRSLFSHAPTRAPPPPQQPAPRRQIAEEDECPICGNELPPKGPNGDDSARTQHVENCIALHSSSPPPASTSQTSISLPSQRTRGMSNAASGNGEGASNSNRLSISARGMFPYIATEKDCVDEDGNDTECVICFEEFQPGDKMARLVCLCKFHEACIRQWWDKKGRGACPTHQLQY